MRTLFLFYTKLRQRENASKLMLGRRGLLTDAELEKVLKEVEVAIAVNVALGVSESDSQEVSAILGQLAPLLADEDGAWSPRCVYRMMGLPQRVQRTWMKVAEAAGNAWIVFVDKTTLTASCGTISWPYSKRNPVG